jgi:signal transduction histidine kinase
MNTPLPPNLDLEKAQMLKALEILAPTQPENAIQDLNVSITALFDRLHDAEKVSRHERNVAHGLKQSLNRFLMIENHCELLGRANDVDNILDSLLSISQHALTFTTAAIYLYDQHQGEYTLRKSQRLASKHQGIIKSHFEEGIITWVMSEKRAAVIPFLQELQQANNTPTTGFVIVPLFSAHHKIGFIEIWPESILNIRGSTHLWMLELLARRAAIAIENSQLYEELTATNEMLKKSQAQAINAEKMAAVGVLASGVAHEVNNPLQVILSRVQLQKRKTHEEEALAVLELVEKQALRIANIVGSILRYAQYQNKPQLQDSRVETIIQDVLQLAGGKLALQNIKVEIETAEDLPKLLLNTGEIEQVLFNLIENARHAMQTGGTLYIRSFIKDGMVYIEIQDTGCGIPKDHLSRIFDPFFTTKGPHEGTGLGLFLCYGIVERHHGKILVQSAPGQGTTFTLRFPLRPPSEHPV